MKFGIRKLELWGYQIVKFLRFDTIPACDRQTGGRMDGHTHCCRKDPR